MATATVTNDFYQVLEVPQTATHEQIVRSYRRLALKIYLDRNSDHNATEAVQLLGRAYETLKDDTKRRAYDQSYPKIHPKQSAPKHAQAPRPSTSTSEPEAPSEAAQIAALEKSKQERIVRWQAKRKAFSLRISEMQAQTRRLEEEIKSLESIAAAEVAARKNSCGVRLVSRMCKQKVDTKEEKELKDRKKQERQIEKDMKERRLESKKRCVREQATLLMKVQAEADAAIAVDDKKIQALESRLPAREFRARQEKKRAKNEFWDDIRKDVDRRNREEAESRNRHVATACTTREIRLAERRAAWARRRKNQNQRRREAAERKRAEAQHASSAYTASTTQSN